MYANVPVVALIGAGASYASGDYEAEARPPLTRDLFSTLDAVELLRTYVLAQGASQVVEREMRQDSTLAFEQALRSLREDGHEHHRLMSLALPLYLQALLLRYSEQLHAYATRYSILVDELLRLRTDVYFVSLNYDTLLDYRLGALSPLLSIDRYIDDARGWSLIKPHGSANWFRELSDPFDPKAPGDRWIASPRIECVPASSFELHVVRDTPFTEADRVTRRYPAIALPEGPKDELVLPPEHLRHFRRGLVGAQQLDLLVLGYSALDTEVLDLIKQSGTRVRRLTVVNRDAREAVKVYRLIERFGIEAVWPDTYAGAYTEWVDGRGLREWVSEFGGVEGGPYPSLIDPDELERRIAVDEVRASLRKPSDEEDDIMTRPF